MRTDDMETIIVFDNNTGDDRLLAMWGFSCLVKTAAGNWLFDSGSNGPVLLGNMNRLGLDPATVKWFFLSHPHWDHLGGLGSLLEKNPALELFMPRSASTHLVMDLRRLGATVTVIGERATAIGPGVFSTGVSGEPAEQALVFDTPAGGVMLVGCAHPGVHRLARQASSILGKKLLLACGGFHLFREDEPGIAKVIDELERVPVATVCPCHCSGEQATAMLAARYGKCCLPGGVGSQLVLAQVVQQARDGYR